MTQVSKFGFFHDMATANSTLGVSDAADGTFYILMAEPMTEEHVLIDLTINGHVYSICGTPANTRTKFYWTLGTSKDKTQVDFVDKKPVAEATEAWPTITAEATTIQFTASTFSGGTDTYPTQLTQLDGVDGKPVKDISMSVSSTADAIKDIQEEKNMGDYKEAARKGCNFDLKTAKATHGKKVILMVIPSEEYVTSHEGIFTDGVPVAIAGQNGLTVSVEADTAESLTKDGDGEWLTQLAGQKSWSISTDGLWAVDDDGRNMIMDALANGTLLCAGVYLREKISGDAVKLTPIRKGMVNVTSDELNAPADDNVTYSVELTGTGPLWMIETASSEEIEAMTIDTSI